MDGNGCIEKFHKRLSDLSRKHSLGAGQPVDETEGSRFQLSDSMRSGDLSMTLMYDEIGKIKQAFDLEENKIKSELIEIQGPRTIDLRRRKLRKVDFRGVKLKFRQQSKAMDIKPRILKNRVSLF